jgi:hypothetical protein
MPISMDLHSAVLEFIELSIGLSDAELDRPWQWRGYDEGVRFAFFRVYEELRWLGAEMSPQVGLSTAQQALAQHHAAYWDLRAALLDVEDTALDESPGDDMWTIRECLIHMIKAEWAFTLVNDFALQRARNGEPEPVKIPEEAWDPHFVDRGGFKDEVFQGSLQDILAFYDGMHQKVLEILKHISPEELSLNAEFWEPQPMEIAFRLIRYDSHLIQHTIQIEKTSAVLGHSVAEVKRLNRRILNALAAVEGLCFVMNQELEAGEETAGYIRRLTGEIRLLLNLE